MLVSLAVLGSQLIRLQDPLVLPRNALTWSSNEAGNDTSLQLEQSFGVYQGEKYVTYLPYSRFSNQRSTLLNAALLAKYLNRTLVVPPMFLGYANGWSPAPGLYNVLENMTNPDYHDTCFDADGNEIIHEPVVLVEGEPPLFGCYNFTTYIIVPWSWATDLQRLTRSEEDGGLGIKIIERQDMSLANLQKQLDLRDEDMFLMQDDIRYQWHIYHNEDQPPNPRYQNEISLKELSAIPHRLLHFYGIFGYDRITIDSPESEEYRLRIQQALIFRHDAVAESSAIIIEQLLNGMHMNEDDLVPLDPIQAQEVVEENGKYTSPRFVAAHIRAGDGIFLVGLKDRIPEFVHQIWDIKTGNETTLDDLIGASNNKTANNMITTHAALPLPKAPSTLRAHLAKLSLSSRLAECAKLKEMVLYVATDAPSPRTNIQLQPVLDAFPCTFFMADFSLGWRTSLTLVRSPLDPHKNLADHLVMFVDATVCAWAERFVGTRTSTFSNYIKQFRHAIVDEIIEEQQRKQLS
ncbi:hypothetical protein DFQ28_004901 [Apophysomyces sp. BC1034]|nr:hypothetical protein DFQ30_004833 [Apophysomyces sp. BC1015]KAG0178168.1 hypothetical protein DFQ29_003845 [Apophysomyces sp. BC1021]KAG0188413.1 hypothetical protein DFQ28_004901 [Apophysomyces sp. BC1034]